MIVVRRDMTSEEKARFWNVRKKWAKLHNILDWHYYGGGLNLTKEEFDHLHGRLWQAMELELVKEGLAILEQYEEQRGEPQAIEYQGKDGYFIPVTRQEALGWKLYTDGAVDYTIAGVLADLRKHYDPNDSKYDGWEDSDYYVKKVQPTRKR